MPTCPPPSGGADDLEITDVGDALGLGLELRETFAGDFQALWLGDADMRTIDFVVLTDECDPDGDRVCDLAALARAVDPLIRYALIWRSVDDLHDFELLTLDYFDHRDLLERFGIRLIDEIAIGTDEFRSLAISTFSDEPGWDNVSHVLDALATDDD